MGAAKKMIVLRRDDRTNHAALYSETKWTSTKCPHSESNFAMAVGLHRVQVDSFEPDLLFEALAGAGFEQRLLKGGRFYGRLDRLFLPHCCLDRGCYSLPCFARGAVSDGVVSLGITRCDSTPAWFNGLELTSHQIQLYAENASIDYRTSSGSPWYVVQLRREFLQQHALSVLGREIPFPQHGFQNIRVSYDRESRILATMESALHFADRCNHSQFSYLADGIESDILTGFVEAVLEQPYHRDGRTCRAAERKMLLIEQVEQILLQQLVRPFRVAEWVDSTEIGQRSLEMLIKDIYGVSARELALIFRLNQVRRELLKCRPGDQSVAAIAKRWGIRHLGRFAAQYAQLFGERPYETLTRTR
jgi:AraC family ethanolamine operon transcriptional activator